MKKFFSILILIILSTCLLLNFNACGEESGQETLNGKTTRQVYSRIVSSVNQAKNNLSYTIDFTASEIVLSAGNAVASQRRFITSAKKDQNNYVYYTQYDLNAISSSGVSMVIKKTYTFIDQTLYCLYDSSLNGQNTVNKTKGSYSYPLSLIYFGKTDSDLINPLYDFSKYDFSKIHFNTQEEQTYFELSIVGQEAKDFAKNILLDTGVSTTNYNCDKVSYIFNVDSEGNLQHVLITFSVTTTQNQHDYRYDYSGTITFSDFGTTVVSTPTDAEDYVQS